MLRWWLAGSHGFFGFLGLQGSCLHTTQLEPTYAAMAGSADATFGVEWSSPTSVTITCNKKPVGSYTKP